MSEAIVKSAEDYLETMVMLKEKNGYVRSVDIAEHLKITKPSVSIAMKKLREANYIEMDKSNFIKLTPKGQEIADKIYTRHKVLAQFFQDLGVDEDTALEDACLIEHDISEKTFELLCMHAMKIHQEKQS